MANVNQTTNNTAARPPVAPPSKSPKSEASQQRDSATIGHREEQEGRGLLGGVADVFIGGGQAIGDMVTGLVTLVTHPIDTITGLGSLITHPGRIVDAFVEPYKKAIDEGRPGLAIGRGIVEVGSLFLGGGVSSGAAHGVMTGSTVTADTVKVAGLGAKGSEVAAHMVKQASSAAAKAAALEAAGYVGEAAKLNQFARIAEKTAIMAAKGTDSSVLRAINRFQAVSVAKNVHIAAAAGAKTMSMPALMFRADTLIEATGRTAEVAAKLSEAAKWSTKLAVQADAVEAKAVILGAKGGNPAAIAHLNEYAKQLRAASQAVTETQATKLAETAGHARGLKTAMSAAEKASAGISDLGAEAAKILKDAPKGAGAAAEAASEAAETVAKAAKPLSKLPEVYDLPVVMGKEAKHAARTLNLSEKSATALLADTEKIFKETILAGKGEPAAIKAAQAHMAKALKLDVAEPALKELSDCLSHSARSYWNTPKMVEGMAERTNYVQRPLENAAKTVGSTVDKGIVAGKHVVENVADEVAEAAEKVSDAAQKLAKMPVEDLVTYPFKVAANAVSNTAHAIETGLHEIGQMTVKEVATFPFRAVRNTLQGAADFISRIPQMSLVELATAPLRGGLRPVVALSAMGRAGAINDMPQDDSAIAEKYGVLATPENLKAFKAEVASYEAGAAIGPDAGEPEQVKYIQTILQQLGYDVQASGTFDEDTAKAVVDFKQKNGLAQTYKLKNGEFDINPYVDEATAKAMSEAIKKKAGPAAEPSNAPQLTEQDVNASLDKLGEAFNAARSAKTDAEKAKAKATLEKTTVATIHDLMAFVANNPAAKPSAQANLEEIGKGLEELGYTPEQFNGFIKEARAQLDKEMAAKADKKPAAKATVSGQQIQDGLNALDAAILASSSAKTDEEKAKARADLEKATRASIHDLTVYGLEHPNTKADVQQQLSSIAASLKEQGYTDEQLKALIADAQKGLVQDKGGAAKVEAKPLAPAATTPAAGAAAAEAKSYTVVRGDSLSKIAHEALGNANRWREIYDLNQKVIGANPNLLLPGQVLQIPGQAATMTPAQAAQAAQAAQTAQADADLAALIKAKGLKSDSANIKAFQAEMLRYQEEGALGPDLGSTKDVILLQRVLGRLGYSSVSESGKYDAETVKAVIDFKTKKGLIQTFQLEDGSFAIDEFATTEVVTAMLEEAKAKAKPQVAPDPVSVA